MDEKTTTHEATKGGSTPSKATLQSYLQNFTREAIDGMVDIMRNSRNEQLKFAAQKLIIDKSIADIKAVEVTGENGGPIKLNIISGADYVSAIAQFATTSDPGTAYGSTAIQSTDMAQTSTQDNDSNQPASEVEST